MADAAAPGPQRPDRVSGAAGAALVRFDQVGLSYGSGPEILSDISFSLPAGSFHFLTGASGAGKSSLLRLMYLGGRPSRGRISLMGEPADGLRRADLARLRRRIGVVFQDFRLIGHLSVFENVALPLRIAGEGEETIRRNVRELLDWVRLGDSLDARPSTLSGGQQQRVAIARAVISRPTLLLADEPTGNVDDRIALRLLHLFEQLHQFGTGIVIATHNEAIVDRFQHPRLHLAGRHLSQLPAGTPRPDDG